MIPLSVIVVNYRSVEFLKSCLASLFQTNPSPASEVLVINNDVTEELAPVLNRAWPNVQFLQNSVNVGFAAGANLGFRKSQGEFVLILNPDVLAQDQAIETLLDTLKINPEAAIAATDENCDPRTVCPRANNQSLPVRLEQNGA